jgi:hypothetical protein
VRFFLVTAAAALILAAGLAVQRDPDRRVDRPLNAEEEVSEARNPSTAIEGARVYAVYMDRRFGTQYDPQFNVSVNEAGTWRGADERINTNFLPGFGDGGSMEFAYVAADGAGRVFALMQGDSLGTLYAHVSPDRGESWPGDPQQLTFNRPDPDTGWKTIRSQILTVKPGAAAVVWEDEAENTIDGRGNVRVRVTRDAGGTWQPKQQINIGDEFIELPGEDLDEERATDPVACTAVDDRLYVAWRDKADPDPEIVSVHPGRILLRYSEDGGQTLLPESGEIRLDRLDTGEPQAEADRPSIDCASDGTVVVAWEDLRSGESEIFFTISRDGALTWTDEVRVDDAPAGVAAQRPAIALGGGEPLRIHVAWQDGREGATDVYVATSEDGGTTWTAGTRVTRSAAAGATPVEEWDFAADGSQVTVAWNDDRDGGAGFDRRDVYAARSLDGGASWGEEARIDLGTGPGEADSDRIDLSVGAESYVVIYRDFRNVIDSASRVNSDIYAGGEGAAVDPTDADADGVETSRDNCPNYPNPEQRDGDYDGIGDLCDPYLDDAENDVDRDGISAARDNCPDVANQLQSDADGDGFGDECDLCPAQPDDLQRDLDGDGVGDACDTDVDGDGIANGDDADDDGDGVTDGADDCPTVPNPLQLDQQDNDGVGDACDQDDLAPQGLLVEFFEEDRVRARWEPEIGAASYRLYFGRAAGLAAGDPGDCYRPDLEPPRAVLTDVPRPGSAYWYLATAVTEAGTEGNGGFASDGTPRPLPGVCDDSAARDWDGDGVENAFDNCPLTANESQEDRDHDGPGDACDPFPGDPEDDGLDRDGVGGDVDNCPFTANPGQADADGDGVGDACDVCPQTPDPLQWDRDHDGVGDACEADSDGDGVPNASDEDRDGDGIPNAEDLCPDTPDAGQADRNDGDGVGDACDTNDQEVGAVRFQQGSTVTLTWARENGADGYAVYGDPVSTLGGDVYGSCLVPQRPISYADVPEAPPPGEATFYLVTGFFDGIEGGSGYASSGEPRSVPGGCQ